MQQLVAFLRAINLGGHRTVRMATLRDAFESLGFSSIQTFIASGNVIFETNSRSFTKVAKAIEKELRRRLGYEVETFIRTDVEIARIANCRPFRRSKVRASADVNIILLIDPLDANCRRELMKLNTDADEFVVCGREIYWRRIKRRRTYSTVPLGRVLRQPFTVRGVQTVSRIATKMSVNAAS